MDLRLYVGKIWLLSWLVAIVVVAAGGGLLMALDHDAWDRFTSSNDRVLATVVDERPNRDGCLAETTTQGWTWILTWMQDGEPRTGTWPRCTHAPVAGTTVTAFVTDDGDLSGRQAGNRYLSLWFRFSLGASVVLMIGWLVGPGREDLKEAAGRASP